MGGWSAGSQRGPAKEEQKRETADCSNPSTLVQPARGLEAGTEWLCQHLSFILREQGFGGSGVNGVAEVETTSHFITFVLLYLLCYSKHFPLLFKELFKDLE